VKKPECDLFSSGWISSCIIRLPFSSGGFTAFANFILFRHLLCSFISPDIPNDILLTAIHGVPCSYLIASILLLSHPTFFAWLPGLRAFSEQNPRSATTLPARSCSVFLIDTGDNVTPCKWRFDLSAGSAGALPSANFVSCDRRMISLPALTARVSSKPANQQRTQYRYIHLDLCSPGCSFGATCVSYFIILHAKYLRIQCDSNNASNIAIGPTVLLLLVRGQRIFPSSKIYFPTYRT
jgi:hypothetical protein